MRRKKILRSRLIYNESKFTRLTKFAQNTKIKEN